ncbi:hypothetical protein PAECIP111892_04854 [Paenibacillus auburnensis]|uniref:N-acetyltransferase domain-containing protein n=1 Tax=Paenibacillus auburnensis TaxID=2905649 RepID=A0ABM9CRF1_9BACL|nr:GNAT family N-acetyltransferase [Paenibacillus auburnensis]CAH1220502.1 hypothetical protein PAECIP111892_04854 [Paenibacillus auburnensis]
MKPLDYVNHIEQMEIELTRLNASRSLIPVERQLEVKTVGSVTLLRDSTDPASVYYNRIKGFGPQMLPELDELLSYYPGAAPCFDMSPDHMTEEVMRALCKKGFFPAEQLVFMVMHPTLDGLEAPVFQIERVTEETAEEFIEWIGKSAGGMKMTREMIARSKEYFYRADFMNYMLRIDGEPAAMGSLFLNGEESYLANDYTFPAYRGKGCQSSLIKHRLAEAVRLGCKAVYTDVEFGSSSHANMERAGFRTAFLNTFWMAE